MSQLNKEKGFTLIELIVLVVIVVVLFGAGTVVYERFLKVTIQGVFRVSPPQITAGVPNNFIYNVTRRKGSTTRFKGLAGRAVDFKVLPSHIVISPATGGTTNAMGDLTVTLTPHIDYRGGGNIWATDATSGKTDPPVFFTVVE